MTAVTSQCQHHHPGRSQCRPKQRHPGRPIAQEDPGIDDGQRRGQAGQRRHHRHGRAPDRQRDAGEPGGLEQPGQHDRPPAGSRRRGQPDAEDRRQRQPEQNIRGKHGAHRAQATGGGREAPIDGIKKPKPTVAPRAASIQRGRRGGAGAASGGPASGGGRDSKIIPPMTSTDPISCSGRTRSWKSPTEMADEITAQPDMIGTAIERRPY